MFESTLTALELQRTLPAEAAERVADLMNCPTEQIVANKKAIVGQEKAIPTRLPPPVQETQPAAYIPVRHSTRRRGLIWTEVPEKQARAREKQQKAMKNQEEAQEQPTRTRKKQRLAAKTVDEQIEHDFVILTPLT
ncbi:MAG: hypothetical protein M1839_003636 [Geoglossum umbratile]|nr:MAG: hypothetical protein M1839_003636 [Geoglossum umbratile]